VPFATINPSTGEITISENAPYATTVVSVFAKDSTGFEYYQNYTLVGILGKIPPPPPGPPVFAIQMKNQYSVKLGSKLEFGLPLYETEGVIVSHSSLPSFATIEKFYYSFKPTTISHLGIFLIKGKLQNT
jgi:hypothetical protein